MSSYQYIVSSVLYIRSPLTLSLFLSLSVFLCLALCLCLSVCFSLSLTHLFDLGSKKLAYTKLHFFHK